MPMAPPLDAVAEDVPLHHWSFGFKQFSFCHIARVLQVHALNVFRHLLLYRHASVPFGFRRQVSL
jgi:hypothetical protein